MTTPRHLELFIRDNKTVAQCRTETNGRLDDPVSIAVAGPEWTTFLSAWNQTQAAEIAALTAERDALQTDLTKITTERDTYKTQADTIPRLTAQVETLTTEKAALQAEVERLTALVPPPPNPREVTPREFLSRISAEDKLAIWNSDDPRCAAAMWELFAATSINLDSPVLSGMIDTLIESGVNIDATERARIFA